MQNEISVINTLHRSTIPYFASWWLVHHTYHLPLLQPQKKYVDDEIVEDTNRIPHIRVNIIIQAESA